MIRVLFAEARALVPEASISIRRRNPMSERRTREFRVVAGALTPAGLWYGYDHMIEHEHEHEHEHDEDEDEDEHEDEDEDEDEDEHDEDEDEISSADLTRLNRCRFAECPCLHIE